jgi:hypothetical protein
MVRVYVGLWGTVDGDGVEYAVKPKPFTPRSIVGMSGSAKRRAARALFVELVITSQGTDITPGDKGQRWFHLWCRGSGDVASRDPDYAALRAKYRIGQKLRPCAGCLRCQCQTAFDAWPELGEELAKDHPTCDGSGVLPARRS